MYDRRTNTIYLACTRDATVAPDIGRHLTDIFYRVSRIKHGPILSSGVVSYLSSHFPHSNRSQIYIQFAESAVSFLQSVEVIYFRALRLLDKLL
jgi:hypothetical protein